MKYVISHENQTIPVPAEIAADEGKLRRALSAIIPGIAEAKINYSAEKEGVSTITIVKTAGTKGTGQDAVAYLAQCPGGVNPVIACYEALQATDLSAISAEEIVLMNQRIEKAVERGEKQKQVITEAFERLALVNPQPAPVVILGF